MLREFCTFNRLNFPQADIEDETEQIAKNYVKLTNYIINRANCIENVGIFGEFYGGHMALEILKNDSKDIFKCAVVISPYPEVIRSESRVIFVGFF